VKVSCRVEQCLVLVLAVELEDASRQVLQRAGGDESAIDERPAASLCRDLTADEQLLAGGLKNGFNARHLFPGADELARSPVPEEQTDGLHEDRFAGPGLTGKDVESRIELDLDRVDDGEPFDAEEAKHSIVAAEQRGN